MNVARILAAVVLILLALIFFADRIPCSIMGPTDGARKTQCMNNLWQIGKACQMYHEDHTNAWPGSCQDLAAYCDGDLARLFVCPASGNRAGAVSNVNAWTDYRLTPLNTGATDHGIHAYCRPANHKGEGGNVLFADGSVYWMPTGELWRIVEQGRR